MDDGGGDCFVDQLFGFAGKLIEVVPVNLADDAELNPVAVHSSGKAAGEVYFLGVSQPADHLFQYLFNACGFHHDPADFLIERMLIVGAKQLAIAAAFGFNNAGFFEFVQLLAHRIAGNAEFLLQSAQPRGSLGVDEKFQQQFNPKFGCDNSVEQKTILLTTEGTEVCRVQLPVSSF